MFALLFILLLLWILPVWVSVHLGNQKGHSLAGWLLGLFLGWIGVIIMVVISPSPEAQRRLLLTEGFACPFCQEPVRHGATVCPHCQRDLKTPS